MNNRQLIVSSGTSWFAQVGPGRIEFDIRPIRYADRRESIGYAEQGTQWLKKLNAPAGSGRKLKSLRRREWD